MMKLVKTLAVGTALALLATGAQADGYAAKKGGHSAGCDNSGRFAGAYIGAHVGSGTLTSDLNTDIFIGQFPGASQSVDGIVAGGQIGYNWQKCNVVFGIEADLAFTNLDTAKNYSLGATRESVGLDWLASIRTKSGIVVGDLFLYATGGLAFASMSHTGTITGVGTEFNMDGTRVGWVAGLGTEWAYNDRISITSDVLYYDLGTDSSESRFFSPTVLKYDDHQSLWVARMGVNFKLGSREAAYEPMK